MDRYWHRFLTSKHFIELRLLRNGDVRRHWLKAKEIDKAQMDQLALMNEYGWEIYAGVNPRPHSCGDVAEIVTLHADVDGMPKKGDVPEPTLIINSGHGYHLYWELARSVAPDPRIADLNRGLAHEVGADPHCCDLQRILRVPGMMNNKQPKRQVAIELESERRYEIEEFEGLERTLGNSGAAANPHRTGCTVTFNAAKKEDAYLRKALAGLIGDGASDARMATILRLNAHGFSLAEIEGIVGDHRWFNKHSKRVTPRDKAIADVRRVLAKA